MRMSLSQSPQRHRGKVKDVFTCYSYDPKDRKFVLFFWYKKQDKDALPLILCDL